MASTVVKSELEEILEKVDVIRKKNDIICLANGGNSGNTKINTKASVLGCGELVSIVDSVQVTRRYSSLFKAQFIRNWAKNLLVPFNKCSSVFEPVVKID